jgi:hypothetical protein
MQPIFHILSQIHNFGQFCLSSPAAFLNNFRIWKLDLGAMIDFQSGGQFFSWSKMLAVKSGQAAGNSRTKRQRV